MSSISSIPTVRMAMPSIMNVATVSFSINGQMRKTGSYKGPRQLVEEPALKS